LHFAKIKGFYSDVPTSFLLLSFLPLKNKKGGVITPPDLSDSLLKP